MSDIREKVLLVHNYYQIPGGEDTVLANEKKLLEDHGHEVIIYSRHNRELKTASTLQKVLLPITSIFNLRTYKEVQRILREEQIDIVHVHNTLTLISPAVYYAAIRNKVPVVQTVHNFRLLCPGATFYRDDNICEDCVEKGMKCAIKHGCYRGSKLQTIVCVMNTKIHRILGIYKKIHYICLTDFNKEKMLQHGQIKENQIFVKPNFVNLVQEGIPYESRKNQMVFVGRLDKLKGIELLLEAWCLLENKNLKLLICGTGPLEEWCRTYITEHNLENVEMKGFVSNLEARHIMRESKAVLLPTQWYEGFPMTMVEAYAAGTPVIGPDMGNVGNLIEESITGWKYPENTVEGISEAILSAVDKSLEKINIDTMKYNREENWRILRNIYSEIQR